MKEEIRQPQTLPTFWQEKFEKSLKPPVKRKRKSRCVCKKVHLLELADGTREKRAVNGYDLYHHFGHLLTTDLRRVTCFTCLNQIRFRFYLKYPDDFPKDYVVSFEKSLSVKES